MAGSLKLMEESGLPVFKKANSSFSMWKDNSKSAFKTGFG